MLKLDVPPMTIKIVCLCAIAINGIFGVISLRSVYADGAYMVYYNLLNSQTYYDFYRQFAVSITQAPMQFFIHLGMTTPKTLMYIYSISLITPTTTLWVIALYSHIKTNVFWAFLLAFTSVYLTSGFFAVGEYNLTYALTACSASILLKDKLEVILLVVLIIASFVLIKSYEATIFLGPILIALSVHRLFKENDRHAVRQSILLANILYIASTIVATVSLYNPRSSTQNAASLLPIVDDPRFLLTGVALSLFFMSIFISNKLVVRIICVAWILTILIFSSEMNAWNLPKFNYAFRSFSGLYLGSLIILIFYARKSLLFCASLEANMGSLPIIAVSFFTLMMSAIIVNTYGFSQWLTAFELQAKELVGRVPIDETTFYHNNAPQFTWWWTNPTLSILLRGNGCGVILNSKKYRGWEPPEPIGARPAPWIIVNCEKRHPFGPIG